MTSAGATCSRTISLSTSSSRPKKRAASSGWKAARPLYGQVAPGWATVKPTVVRRRVLVALANEAVAAAPHSSAVG